MAQKYHVLAAVAAGYVTIMLAVSPASVALPTIAASLDIDVEEASWIMNSYLLVLAACLLPAGRIGDLVGFKPVYLAGLVLATVASFFVGLTTELPLLITLRAVQGVGAALISGTSLAMLTAAFPLTERGRVVGFATVAAAVGAGGGTLLVPLALHLLGWRGVFWMVAPVGLLGLALTLPMPRPPQPERSSRSVDVPGALLLAGSLFALAASFSHLHEGEETFEAGWPFHTGTVAVAAALFGAFLWVERRAPQPLVRLDYVRNLPFAAAVGANGIYHMTMMATFFLTPFLFERAWGLTTLHASLVIGLVQATNLSAALLAGWVVDRTGWRHIAPMALGLVAAGMLALGLLVEALDFASYTAVTLLLGLGSGFFNTSNNTTIMSILPDEARGFSSGMLETTRQFGHTVAVSLGAVALGLAGASLRGAPNPEATLVGFQLAEIAMGAIALVGVAFAAAGRLHAISEVQGAPAERRRESASLLGSGS